MRPRDEGGQITLLIIGFVLIAVLAVAVVANASKAFVYRRSLASWADGAAVTAAQSVAEEAIYAGPRVDELPLSGDAVEVAVADYVARNGLPDRFEDFAASVDVGDDGATVTVELSARVSFVLGGDDGGISIIADATATVPLR
ncbi:MAG: pilus assembly protein TadG-related protein [Jiangellaceae bacterium]